MKKLFLVATFFLFVEVLGNTQIPVVICSGRAIGAGAEKVTVELLYVHYGSYGHYALRYMGPAYSFGNIPGGIYLDPFSTAYKNHFRCVNNSWGYHCEVGVTHMSIALSFDFKLNGDQAILSYRDGKPINLDAKLYCQPPQSRR